MSFIATNSNNNPRLISNIVRLVNLYSQNLHVSAGQKMVGLQDTLSSFRTNILIVLNTSCLHNIYRNINSSGSQDKLEAFMRELE